MSSSTPPVVYPVLAAAPVAGCALWAGGDAWRLGGGLWALGLLIGLFGVVGPALLAEAAVARAGRAPLPVALGRIAGDLGAWLGWLGLAAAALLAALGVALSCWSVGLALFGPGAARGGVAGLLCVGSWVLATATAARPATRERLMTGCARGMVGLAALGLPLALALSPDALFSLFEPRLSALRYGLGGAIASGLLAAPIGLGLVSMAVARLHDRARSAAAMASTAVVAVATLVALAITGFTLLFTMAQAPSPEGDLALGLLATLDAGRDAAPLGLRLWLASTFAVGTFGLALCTVDGVASAISETRPPVGAVGATLGATSVALALVGLADPQGLGATVVGLMTRWLCGWGLPAIALGCSAAIGWARQTPALLRELDREGGLRLGRWLPFTLRWVTPGLLLLALAGQHLPLEPLPPERGGAGALGSVAHALAPALVLLWLGISSTLATWVPARAPRET